MALGLTSCGDLPRPFEGNPGREAMRLAQPPPARLAVPMPMGALLSDAGSAVLARDVAAALLEESVPAMAEAAKPGDWRLAITASLDHGMVTPNYTVQNPRGQDKGSVAGRPVSAAAWSRADPAMLHQVAGEAGGAVATLLTSIEAAIQQADPNSLVNRPAKLAFLGVTGAPGDGDESLARLMRLELPKVGDQVQDSPRGADYLLRGQVKTAPGEKGMLRVEIQWIVKDQAGREAGRVAQINEVPLHTLDGMWGDIALVVAQQAAAGVRDVILNQTAARQLAARQAAAKEMAAAREGAAKEPGAPDKDAPDAAHAP